MKHPHSRQTALNSIVEEDESLADTLVADRDHDFDTTGFPRRDQTRLVGKAQFIDALAGSDYDEGSEGSEEEDIDIDISSGSGSSEDEDEDLTLSQPVKQRLPHITKSIRSQSCESTATKSRRHRHTKHEPNMEDTYDPSTCRKWPN